MNEVAHLGQIFTGSVRIKLQSGMEKKRMINMIMIQSDNFLSTFSMTFSSFKGEKFFPEGSIYYAKIEN